MLDNALKQLPINIIIFRSKEKIENIKKKQEEFLEKTRLKAERNKNRNAKKSKRKSKISNS